MVAVTVVEHFFIPMKDGVRLAARMWLPADAEHAKAPALLEYIPYRKRDGTRARDEPMHGWFAAHGYAAVRVDMRGSGESDGHMADEYLAQELSDACEVIDWLSRQSWCTGRVGMMGKSWGGFNALQTAALRPPALKAIITVCSTDDRYADDIHYMGGALLNDNLWWGTIMLAFQARPPDPELVGAELARTMAGAAETTCRSSPRSGWRISGATATGGTARSARTSPPSNVPCSRSAVGRTLTQRHTSPARRPHRAAQRADRPLGAPLSARRQAGTRNRISAGSAALVGSLVEG